MLIFNQDINLLIQQELAAAERKLTLMMYSISPPTKASHKLFIDTWRSLEHAIKRGIETKIILCGWPSTNPQAAATAQAALKLSTFGAKVKIAEKGIIFHPKAWAFDDKKLIIGSHNATDAGMTKTKNISYFGQDQAEVEQFNQFFLAAWHKLPAI